MTLLIISFIAGILTILAPCVLPVLPIIIGRSVEETGTRKPWVIITSLAASIVLFTLLLKSSTLLITIPQSTWAVISGGIIIFFGLITVFPKLWDRFSLRFNLLGRSNKVLGESSQKKGLVGDILMGAALGPVFSSCSPTYFIILATVLPQSFITGLVYLIVYAVGLAIMLLLISHLGQRFVSRLTGVADPHSWFKRGLGILFIVVGVAMMFGIDKQIESALIEHGYLGTTLIEQQILDRIDMQ